MGILARSIGFRNLSIENPSTPLLPISSLLEGLGRSDSGIVISERQAHRIASVYTSWNIISSDLARCSLDCYQLLPDNTIVELPNSKWAYLLKHEPNPWMTSNSFWVAIITAALAYGNGYAFLQRDNAQRVIAMYPLAPDKTSPVFIEGQLKYVTSQNNLGLPQTIEPEDILHIPGLSFNGYVGISPIRSCMNAFGIADAVESYGALFFANGARATGVLSHPGQLSPEAQENIVSSLRRLLSGKNALSPFVLEEGMKWEQVSVPNNEAQFLETRQFQDKAICSGIYRIPGHLWGSTERSTNNNIEHQGLDYVRYCLAPWSVRIQQEIKRKLFGTSPFFAEHNFNELSRGDIATQSAAHQIYRNIGVYSTNDILRDLRRNPISTEEGGDVRTVQGAMLPLSSYTDPENFTPGQGGNANTGKDPAGQSPNQNKALVAYRTLFRDAVGRVANRQKREPNYVASVFVPILNSMLETVNLLRFGTVGLTDKEKETISAYAATLATQSESWKADAETAARVANEAYKAIT